MKKFLTVLFCTYIFLFNDIGTANIVSNTKKEDEKILVKESINEKTETMEVEPEKTNDSYDVDSSIADEYIEEDNTVYENYSENYGTYGRLYISWYDVALYDYNVNTISSYSLQELVDNYDSAAFYENKGRLVIADHYYQGLSVLYDLSEGTTSYIKFPDGSTNTYSLIKKEIGYNTGPDLEDVDGNSFYDRDSDLIMYTCLDDKIMVTLWVLV